MDVGHDEKLLRIGFGKAKQPTEQFPTDPILPKPKSIKQRQECVLKMLILWDIIEHSPSSSVWNNIGLLVYLTS